MLQSQAIPYRKLKFWYKYKSFISDRTCDIEHRKLVNIDGWRHRLFTNFITYLLPSCFIALIPGVYMSMVEGYIVVGIADILTVILIPLIAINQELSITLKKVLVISILYILAGILIVNLSLLGPGLVYLLTLSVVIAIVSTYRWAHMTIVLNFLVCLGCAAIIHFKLFDSNLVKDYSLAVWITVSSNLIFLSFVIVILVSKTIQGLEKTIAKEILLKNELYQKTNEQIETNKQLLESEGHYKSLFYKNPSPMWVFENKTFRFLQVNQAAIKNYGYTTEEFMSMNILDVKTDSDIDSIKLLLDENESYGNPSQLVAKHRKKDGEQFYVEVVFNSINFNGKEAILAISTDITRQIEYIKSINEQNEKLKEIAWIHSHKVRAPLANLMALIQLYQDSLPEIPEKDIMEGILLSASKLDGVIKETVLKTID